MSVKIQGWGAPLGKTCNSSNIFCENPDRTQGPGRQGEQNCYKNSSTLREGRQ